MLLSGLGSCSVRGLKGQNQLICTEGWRSKPVPFLVHHPVPFCITLSATFKCHTKLQSQFLPKKDHPGCCKQA